MQRSFLGPAHAQSDLCSAFAMETERERDKEQDCSSQITVFSAIPMN